MVPLDQDLDYVSCCAASKHNLHPKILFCLLLDSDSCNPIKEICSIFLILFIGHSVILHGNIMPLFFFFNLVFTQKLYKIASTSRDGWVLYQSLLLCLSSYLSTTLLLASSRPGPSGLVALQPSPLGLRSSRSSSLFSKTTTIIHQATFDKFLLLYHWDKISRQSQWLCPWPKGLSRCFFSLSLFTIHFICWYIISSSYQVIM